MLLVHGRRRRRQALLCTLLPLCKRNCTALCCPQESVYLLMDEASVELPPEDELEEAIAESTAVGPFNSTAWCGPPSSHAAAAAGSRPWPALPVLLGCGLFSLPTAHPLPALLRARPPLQAGVLLCGGGAAGW